MFSQSRPRSKRRTPVTASSIVAAPPLCSLRSPVRRFLLLPLLLIQATPTLAQSSPPPALGTAPEGTRLIILGTAGGPPLRRDRSEPANLLQVGNRSYLFDAGIGTVRRLLDAGIRPETISTIFITHHHPDHDLDLAALIANDVFAHPWFAGLGSWRIYGPPGTKEMTDAALRYISVPMGAFHAEGLDGKEGRPTGTTTRGNPWMTYLADSHADRLFAATNIVKDGLVFSDGSVRVYAARNTHYSLLPAGAYASSMISYSYRVETPDKTIVFTGDTGFSPAVAKLAKGADIIVSEVMNPQKTVSGLKELARRNNWSPAELQHAIEHMFAEHMTPEQVGRMATEAGAKSVVLTHFVPGSPDGSDSAEDVAEIRKTFAGKVSAAHDLSVF